MQVDTAPAVTDKIIVNPLSGERIVIGAQPAGSDHLAWELILAPGGRVPSSHAHPEQEECFTVVAGRLRFRVGWRRVTAGPGTTVRVPPGTVHHFANAGPGTARALVRTTPALDMAGLLQTAAAMARDQHAARRRMPRLGDLMLFMRDFEREVRAPYLPAAATTRATRLMARLAERAGRDGRYRRLRGGAAPDRPASRRPAGQARRSRSC
jgi:quercetin dioxygenase-like cupin family protein